MESGKAGNSLFFRFFQKNQKSLKKLLTNQMIYDIIYKRSGQEQNKLNK
jgi:hypothetical protein